MPLVEGRYPLDRNVKIAHGSEFAIQPLQFVSDLVADGVRTIGEKNRIAVRKCVSATRIWCSAAGSPFLVPSSWAQSVCKWRRATIRKAVSHAIAAFSLGAGGRRCRGCGRCARAAVFPADFGDGGMVA